MAKKTTFSCTKCGAQFLRWTGRCTECGAWSTVIEDTVVSKEDAQQNQKKGKPGETASFAALTEKESAEMHKTGILPFDRVLSGGLVSGSITLVGGEPGIGKSTLLAQTAIEKAKTGATVLYITGEESPAQVALRLKRMTPAIPEKLLFLDQTDVYTIARTIESEQPALAIVDSIQTIQADDVAGSAGSITQTKACAAILTETAKQTHVPIILVGQVNKEGDIAGPRLLEHMVDTVLMLEGDPQHRFRMLRALKHRFGPTDEVSILSMTEKGLEDVDDPSAELLRERPVNTSGSIVSCLMEGHRAILIELQALVTAAGYATPVRRTAGVDSGRLGLLLAVLAKRAGLRVLDKDIYANATGGLKAKEPAIDLALCLAIASGLTDVPLNQTTAAFGEVGLGGEVRPVPYPELRIRECTRHGFSTIILPKGTKIKAQNDITIVFVQTIKEAIEKAMGKT